jgi:ribosome-associated protein
MPATRWILAGKSLRIPRSELEYRATRSSGPGGQHVNTSSTRVELWWNLELSAALGEPQRTLLRERLANRVDAEGWLRLVESGTRSQLRNRESVTERFAELLERAVRPRKTRRATRVPVEEKKRRLEAKRQRAAVKRLRGRISDDE